MPRESGAPRAACRRGDNTATRAHRTAVRRWHGHSVSCASAGCAHPAAHAAAHRSAARPRASRRPIPRGPRSLRPRRLAVAPPRAQSARRYVRCNRARDASARPAVSRHRVRSATIGHDRSGATYQSPKYATHHGLSQFVREISTALPTITVDNRVEAQPAVTRRIGPHTRRRPVRRCRIPSGACSGWTIFAAGRNKVCSSMYCPAITACEVWSEKQTQTLPGGNGMVCCGAFF